MTTSDAIAALSLAVAFGTLLYTARGVNAARRATQLQVFDSLFREIRTLDAEYARAGRIPSQQWCFDFFNTLEYLAFLLNRDLVMRRELFDFYRDAVLHWYRTFSANATRRQLDDADCFPEFKKLHRTVIGNVSTREWIRSAILRWL